MVESAIGDFGEAIRLGPEQIDGYAARGLAYVQRGDFGKALQDFDEVVVLAPRRPEGYAGRGDVYLSTGKTDRAIEELGKAIDRASLRPGLYYLLRARAFHRKGEFGRAWADVKKARALGAKVDEAFLEEIRRRVGRPE
jgi:tetratricopeptide (TPR) repeat protein